MTKLLYCICQLIYNILFDKIVHLYSRDNFYILAFEPRQDFLLKVRILLFYVCYGLVLFKGSWMRYGHWYTDARGQCGLKGPSSGET